MRIASILVAASAIFFQAGNAFAGVSVTPVPEPSSLALAAVGFGAVAVVKFLRKR